MAYDLTIMTGVTFKRWAIFNTLRNANEIHDYVAVANPLSLWKMRRCPRGREWDDGRDTQWYTAWELTGEFQCVAVGEDAKKMVRGLLREGWHRVYLDPAVEDIDSIYGEVLAEAERSATTENAQNLYNL